MQSKIERINKLIRHLVFKEKLPVNSIQKVIAEKLNANKISISRALSGNEEYLTDSFIERLNNAFDNEFNLDWLLTGIGNMQSGKNAIDECEIKDKDLSAAQHRTIEIQARTIETLSRTIETLTQKPN